MERRVFAREADRLLRLRNGTTAQLVKAGKVPGQKFGTRWRVLLSRVEKAVEVARG